MRKWKRVFIVGTGLGHYLSHGCFPLAANIKASHFRQTLPSRFDSYFAEYHKDGEDDIESVLMQLELNSQIPEPFKADLNMAIYMGLQKRYSLHQMAVSSPSAFQRADSFMSRLFQPDDVIIAMNADMLIDHTLSKLNIWSPLGNGYGSVIGNYSQDLGMGTPNQSLYNIKLLKLRGSFNFLNWAGCRELGILVNAVHESFLDSGLSAQMRPIFSNVKGNQIINAKPSDVLKPALPAYLLPFHRNHTFIQLWHEAISHIRQADIVALIGYRFLQTDAMMRFLLSCCDRNDLPSQIHIVDYSRQIEAVKSRLCEVLDGNPDSNILWFGSPVDCEPDGYMQLLNALGQTGLGAKADAFV